MFQPWRMQLRKANAALRAGRLDEAFEMVSHEHLRQFQQAKQLMARLAEEFVRRGTELAQQGDFPAAWNDYDRVRRLGVDQRTGEPLKKLLVDRMLVEANDWIRGRQPHLAIAALDQLLHRAPSPQARSTRQLATKVRAALESARRGNFALAIDQMTSAACLRPELEFLAEQLGEVRGSAARFRELGTRLHQSLANSDWHDVLQDADEMLELAPEYQVAREARQKAWAAVNAKLDETIYDRRGGSQDGLLHPAGGGTTRSDSACALAERPQTGRVNGRVIEGADLEAAEQRFLLWVDEVGAYLVCTGDRVRLGQPVPGNTVEVPIMADISRHHATIRRDGEGYLLEARRRVLVDGRPVASVVPLAHGNVIQLGDGVKLRFQKPHALSNTARLDFLTPHRTTPTSDAVLLMADTCVIGPRQQSHIVCPQASGQTVLFRRAEELLCRSSGELDIDGDVHQGQGPLTTSSRVIADELTISLEEL